MKLFRNPLALLMTAIVLCLVLLQVQLWVSHSSVWAIIGLHQKIATEQAKNQVLQTRNDKLYAEVLALKTGDHAIESRARGELGLIKQGEIFYQIVGN